MCTPVDCLATLMLMSGIVRYMDKDNAYYVKIYSEYVKQFGVLHAQTVERINRK